RHGDCNPLRARTFMTANIAAGHGLALTERACDTLPWPLFGFAIAGGSAIRGIAQHPPHSGSLPAAVARPCRDLALIQQTRNGVDAESLLRIHLKHHPHHTGLGLDDLVECRRDVTLPQVPISIRRAG